MTSLIEKAVLTGYGIIEKSPSGNFLPSRSKNAYFESYKISAKPREIKACGILQSGRFMSEKGVNKHKIILIMYRNYLIYGVLVLVFFGVAQHRGWTLFSGGGGSSGSHGGSGWHWSWGGGDGWSSGHGGGGGGFHK
jgi:hypothetical protein